MLIFLFSKDALKMYQKGEIYNVTKKLKQLFKHLNCSVFVHIYWKKNGVENMQLFLN